MRQNPKKSTGQGDDYTTGCLLDFVYFLKKYRLIAADLSKQKVLDADSRAIQQIMFTGKIKSAAQTTRVTITFLNSQKSNTRICKRNNKNVVTTYKWLNTVK